MEEDSDINGLDSDVSTVVRTVGDSGSVTHHWETSMADDPHR